MLKKMIIIGMLAFACIYAESADTTSTSIGISDMQFYTIIPAEGEQEGFGIKTLKPFAIIQPEDKWFSKDKWMHFTTAYFISLQSNFTLNEMFYTRKNNARYVSLGITLSLSLGKEVYDTFAKGSYFSWKDLCYDILGAGLAYYTSQLIYE